MRKPVRRLLLGVTLFLSLILAVKGSSLLIATGTWQSTGTLSNPRSGAAATLLSGRILVTGGDPGTGPVTNVDSIGLDGVVAPAAPMLTARSKHVAVTLQDGRVLVAGGVTTGGGTTNAAEIYDPVANAWSSVAYGMNEARSGATAARLLDGRVVIAGGQNGSVVSSTIEIFDPIAGVFSIAGTMSSPRTQHAMALLNDGRVLIVGGFNGTGSVASTDVFDPTAVTLNAGPTLAVARFDHSATTLQNGQVVVVGGNNGSGNPSQMELGSAELFDPVAGTFTTLAANLLTPREGHLAVLLPNNNSILIVGGSSAGNALSATELFTAQDSPTGTWSYAFTPTNPMTAARNGAAASANQVNGPVSVNQLSGVVLVAGGSDATGNALGSTEGYGYATVQTDQSDYAPGTTVTITGSGFQPNETITIQLVESPFIDTHGPYTVQANANGNFVDQSFTTDSHDVDVRFFLTVTGGTSGFIAQNTFTDAAPTLTMTVNGSGSITATRSSGTETISSCTGGTCTFSNTPTAQAVCSSGTCKATWSANYNATLTATPNGGFAFTGWSGAGGCTGTGSCSASATGSNDFAVTATFTGPATKLVYTSVPTTGTAGTAFSVTVQSQDANGNPSSPTSNTTITLSKTSGGGTLSGMLTGVIPTSSNSVTISGVVYSKADTMTLTATATAGETSLTAVTSGNIAFSPGATTLLAITGSGTQTAGTSQNLAITAQDAQGNTATSYTGSHNLTFSGANSSPSPATSPTVKNSSGTAINFGSATAINFTNGVATVSGSNNGVMTLYDVQTATISVSDGTISSSGVGNLTVTVSAGTLNKFALVLASPQTDAVAFTGTNTLTADDTWGNPVTTFNASTNNVTITANTPLTGTVSGLGSGGNNVLNQASNFSSGVANLTALGMKYTGNATIGTVTATATGATGTSGNVTINAGAATKLVITGSGTQTAGNSQNLTITAQDAQGNTATSYTGSHSLTFSGANSSPSPATSPTVKNSSGTAINFGSATAINFTNGVATVSGSNNGVMTLYDVQTAIISVSDGTISSSGVGNLTVTVSAGTLNKFALVLASPQTDAVAFTGTNTLTADDTWGNPVTTFNASINNVTITANAPLTTAGTAITGLGSGNNNILNQAGNFTNGVASLTGSLTYTGLSGMGTFTATATGATGTSGNVTINAGAATKFVITGSGTQTAGTNQNLTITAQDAGGNAATGYTGSHSLTFSGASSSPSPATPPTLTNSGGTAISFGLATPINFANGVATVSGSNNGVMTLYDEQVAVISATDGTISSSGAGNLTVTVSAAGAKNFTLVSGNSQSGTVATALTNPFVVEVTDQFGNPVPGTTVNFAVTGGGGSLSATAPVTNASGQASSTLTLGTVAGTNNNTATATVSGLTGSPVTFTASATAGAAKNLTLVSGNNQSGTVGTALTNAFVVEVTDQFSNPVSGTTVTFAVTAGGGSLSATAPVTNASGQASSTLTLGTTAGTNNNTATATVTGLTGSPVTFTASATAGAASKLVYVSGNGQSGTVGATLTNAFVVEVTDPFSNPVSGTTVTFAVTGGGGSLSATSGVTGANGQKSSTLTLGTVAGNNNNTATASVTGLTGSPVTFTASALPGAITHLALSPATSSINAGQSQSYTAEGLDFYNNPTGDLTSATTFAIGPDGSCNSGTDPASCTATVADVNGSSHTVTGTYPNGAQGTASLTVNPASPTQLVITSKAFTVIAGQCPGTITVTSEDQYNNTSNVSSATQVDLKDASATGNFYSDAACQTLIPVNNNTTSVTIPANSSSQTFSYTDTTLSPSSSSPAFTTQITAADDAKVLTSGTQNEEILQLVFTTPSFTVTQNACSGKISLATENASGTPTNITIAATLGLTSTSTGATFSSDTACSMPIAPSGMPLASDVMISAGSNAVSFSYQDSMAGNPIIAATIGGYSVSQQEQIGTPPKATTNPSNVTITYGGNGMFMAAACQLRPCSGR